MTALRGVAAVLAGVGLLVAPLTAQAQPTAPGQSQVVAKAKKKASSGRTFRVADPVKRARVRIVDRAKSDSDVVRVSGSVSSRAKHLKRLVHGGVVATVSTRASGGVTVPLAAISFHRGQCQRHGPAVWCNARNVVFRARATGSGRLQFAARVSGHELRQTAKTRLPVRLQVATPSGIWAAAPRKCVSRRPVISCRGRSAPWALRSAPARGPVSQKWVRQVLTTGPRRTAKLAADEDQCGTVMTNAASGVIIATGFISLIPEGGEVLAPVLAAGGAGGILIGTDDGAGCIEAEFSMINQQLANQETQIADLQNDLELSENQFYQGELSNSVATTEVSAKIYSQSLQALSPTTAGGPGLFGQFMEQSGLWTLGMQPVAGSSIQGSATNPSTFQGAMSMATNSSAFTQNLNNMSGSQIPVTKCAQGGCANVVQASPTSALLGMWNSKAQTLLKAWQAAQDAGGPSGSNVVALYDEYNNSIIADYAQSLSTLQQAFQMEYMANQMNLYHAQQECSGSSAACQQIQSFGTVPGTWYSYNTLGASASQNSQIKAYNNAQKQLTATYASRLNTLYINALNYTVTDVPVGSQAYPTVPGSYLIKNKLVTSPNPINYATQVGAALPGVLYGPARTPLLQLPSVTAGAWTSQAALYQFGGLRDVNTCSKTVAKYTKTYGTSSPQVDLFDPANCPAIFVQSNGDPLNQGYYDGDRIQPYTSYNTSAESPVLTGVMQVNLRLCNATSPQLSWYVADAEHSGNAAGLVQGQTYLSCGNWAKVVTNQSFPGAHNPTAWSQLAPSPSSYVTSQYYQTGNSYPSATQSWSSMYMFSNNDGGYDEASMYYAGASPVFNSSSGVTYGSDGYWIFNKVTTNSSTWLYSVGGLPTANAANPAGAGFNIPVRLAYYSTSKNEYYGSIAPRQDAQIAVDGFTCSATSCTVADGGTFNFQMGPNSWSDQSVGYITDNPG